ncbi:hypothetical protein ABK040_008563 [Willaertia magna]
MSSYKSRILNVAEKPDAAKQIANALSNGKFKSRNGKSKYNRIYEFDYRFKNQNVTMVVTSVTGHLMEIDFELAKKNWHSCDPSVLMDVTTPVLHSVPKKSKDVEANLITEAKDVTKLILWLDCDREGENISFEVIDVCKKVNRVLSIENGTILRAKFSELKPQAIHRAIATLVKPNELDSLAVEARKEIDLRIGAAFTRFQTMRLRQKFTGLSESLISYGPCQFPTLGFVVRRDLIIKNFQPEKFWYIKCTHIKEEEGKVELLWKRGRLFDQLACIVIYELCVENPLARVIRVQRKERRKKKPVPLNTVELQKLASRKLKFGAHETMTLAETLYNKGFISYPRTETNKFTFSDDEFGMLIQEHTNDSNWGSYADSLLNQGKYQRPYFGNSDDKAHPPIHPIKGGFTSSNSKEEQLYELIVRHFLACCSQDAIGFETKSQITIANEEFTCSGLMVTQKNYLDIWKYDQWSDKTIPVFMEGETFTPTSLMMEEGETRAPPHLSESDLIACMDSNGIGTDATIAQHIKTIQERQYVTKKGNRFEATNLGIALVQAYDLIGYELSQPNLRAKMEKDMIDISRGISTKDLVVTQSLTMYKHIFSKITQTAIMIDKSVGQYYKSIGEGGQSKVLFRAFSACGVCEQYMDLKCQGETRFLFCGSCKESYTLPGKGELTVVDHNCPICNFQAISVTTQKGTNYNVCPSCFSNPPEIENCEESFVSGFRCFNCTHPTCPLSKKRDNSNFVKRCELCGNGMVLRQTKSTGAPFIGCKGFPNCNNSYWLPSASESVEISNDKCDNCSHGNDTVYKLRFKFQSSASLPPGVGNEHTTCVFCDNNFKDYFNIRSSSNSGNTSNRTNNFNNNNNTNNSPFQNTISQRKTTTASNRNVRNSLSPSKGQRTLDSMLGKRDTQTRPANNFNSKNNNSQVNVTMTRTNSFNNNNFNNNSNNRNTSTTNNNRNNAFNNNNNKRSNNNNNNNGEPVVCTHCGETCIILSCKQGANTGRRFYKCSHFKETDKAETCAKFFEWVDPPNN